VTSHHLESEEVVLEGIGDRVTQIDDYARRVNEKPHEVSLYKA
jgi:hypothetical protein